MDTMSDQPNVVWVTLDSVRFDHTSLSGYNRKTNPNLKCIAAGHRLGIGVSNLDESSRRSPNSS